MLSNPQDPRSQSQPQYASLPSDSVDRIFTEKELDSFSTLSLLKLARLKGSKDVKLGDSRAVLTRSVLTAQIPKPVGRPHSTYTSTEHQADPLDKRVEIANHNDHTRSSTKQELHGRTPPTESHTSCRYTCPACKGRGFISTDELSAVDSVPTNTTDNTRSNGIDGINSINGNSNGSTHYEGNGHLLSSTNDASAYTSDSIDDTEHTEAQDNRSVHTRTYTLQSPYKGRGRRLSRDSLSLPQIRVLCTLAGAEGPLTKSKISEICGNKTPVLVSRAVGYSNPAKRNAFENSREGGFRLSLLTLEYVCEVSLDIDGVEETAYELTELGRVAYKKLQDEGKTDNLPPLRDWTVPTSQEAG